MAEPVNQVKNDMACCWTDAKKLGIGIFWIAVVMLVIALIPGLAMVLGKLILWIILVVILVWAAIYFPRVYRTGKW